MSLFNKRIKDLHELLHKKEISVSDLVEESLTRINSVEEKVNAFLQVTEEIAREKAKQLDDKLASGQVEGSLFGIPMGLKDNLMTKDIRTTCASKYLENFIPLYDATVVERLKEANAVLVGKLNMDEFSMGSSTESSAFKTTANPWNVNYVPGGSSGGSAASVAAGEVLFSIGSDTGGSIRQPAAYCGVVGMKPTYGRVSRYGLVAFSSSLDQVGPITRTVEDNAYVLQAIAGNDARDTTSANIAVPNFVDGLTGDIKDLKVAVPKEYMGDGVSENVREQMKKALATLESLGATVEEVSLPHTMYATAVYHLITTGEASASLARFDGIRYGRRVESDHLLEVYKNSRGEGFGEEVKRRILLGTYALSTGNYEKYYKKAQQVRTLMKEDFDAVFEKYDVIVGPTTPTTAFKFGEKVDNPLTMYANDILTSPASLAGLPAISVPAGLSEGLPVGLQIIGKHFDEATVYRVAHAFEQANEFTERPNI